MSPKRNSSIRYSKFMETFMKEQIRKQIVEFSSFKEAYYRFQNAIFS